MLENMMENNLQRKPPPPSESQAAHDNRDVIYTRENIAELKVDLLEGEDHGMLEIENVTRKEHPDPSKEPEKVGRHTNRKKKISPRRILPSTLPDSKEVTNSQPKTEGKKRTEYKTDDPEYVPDTSVQAVSSENRRL